MGEVVNLRRARKASDRRAREAEAAVARAEHGIPKALRKQGDAQRVIETRRLDAHRREPPDVS